MKTADTFVMQLVMPLAIAAFSLALALGMPHWTLLFAHADAGFSQLITGGFGMEASKPPGLPWVSLALVFTVTAAFAGYKLGPRASVVALLQLFVLAFLCLWVLWNWYAVGCHLLILFVAMTTALLMTRAASSAINRGSDFRTHSYELMLRNLELKKTRLQIVQQDEVERRLLAADLHDQVLNDLKMAKQKLAEHKLQSSSAAEIESRISIAMEGIHEVMDHLCPSVLEHLGLRAAVDELLHRASLTSGMKKRLYSEVADEDLSTLSTTAQALLYRLIQESINNACKHSRGKTLTVNISKLDGEIVIQVADDGKGAGVDLNSHRNGNSRGIRYMKQRADLIGAKIAWHVNGVSGGGTIVEIKVPVRQDRKRGQ